ncbi:phosphatidylglycerophosphatase A family protein [Phosphitispora fastidiosa]|uniref:phosphatidylglycerophosphatase A family protein n=1 Tax=Phosphitispora fastidiosa TaxID=2837202 RepID=UPI001E39F74C|nr:phosphatidylglycerophosphatase A [Phosphitispora fastidiosa]MBU7005263.1 phosphatidylglycerophosphatase A [Phosphitispora fastidiosa]
MRKNIIILLASGFGLGLIPKAPGTFGTLLGLVLAVLFPDNIFLITSTVVLGIWISQEAEMALQEHDSPKIIVDEIAGYLIAVYTWNGIYLIIGFLLFRALDILKPAPINRLQKLPGGFGVMADDLAAGLITNIIMQAAVFVFLHIF